VVNQSGDTFLPAHFLLAAEGIISNFELDRRAVSIEDVVSSEFGPGRKFTIPTLHKQLAIEQILVVELYDRYPNSVITQVSYTNRSDSTFAGNELVSNYYLIDPSIGDHSLELWTFQGIAYAWGADYIFPLKAGFERQNFSGFQPRSRMGGGVPVT